MSLGNGTGGATVFIALNRDEKAPYTIESNKGEIIIHINEKSEIKIYDMKGNLLYLNLLEEGMKRISLEKGFYIVNEYKVMVH